jgi:hypothetical protein
VLRERRDDAYVGSDTAVLDAYLDLLLGLLSVDNPRQGLDHVNRTHVLECLAGHLVESQRDNLSRRDLYEFLLGYFKSYGWVPRIDPLIEDLVTRRILAEQPREFYRFRQPAFLVLFAARWYQRDPAFKHLLLESIDGWPDIIRHASGLSRAEELLLRRSHERLGCVWEACRSDGDSIFDLVAVADGWNLEDLPGVLSSHYVEHEDDPETRDAILDEMWDLLDSVSSRSAAKRREPGDVPPLIGFAESLTLASSVLRNSELVPNVALKTEVLIDLLSAWADLAALLISEPAIERTLKGLFEQVLGVVDGDARLEARFQRLRLVFPIVIIHASVSTDLGSTKLSGVLESILGRADLKNRPGAFLVACILAAELRIGKWVGYLGELLERHGDRQVIREGILWLLSTAFWDWELESVEEEAIHILLARVLVHGRRFDSDQARKGAISKAMDTVRKRRLARDMRAHHERAVHGSGADGDFV